MYTAISGVSEKNHVVEYGLVKNFMNVRIPNKKKHPTGCF